LGSNFCLVFSGWAGHDGGMARSSALRTPKRRRAGGPVGVADLLLHPIVLGALCVWLLNDHLLKEVFPGVVTGKLSDVAGLVVAPVCLAAVSPSRRGTPHEQLRTLERWMVAVACGFTAIQVWPPAAWLYTHALGVLQWPWYQIWADAPVAVPVAHTMDPTDLVALPVLLGLRQIATRHLTIT